MTKWPASAKKVAKSDQYIPHEVAENEDSEEKEKSEKNLNLDMNTKLIVSENLILNFGEYSSFEGNSYEKCENAV